MNKELATLALVAGTAVLCRAGPASANDWEGPSIGIGGGYAMANSPFSASVAPLPGLTASEWGRGAAATGGLFSLSAGYDHDLFGPVIVGAFVDYDFSDIDTHIASSQFGFDGGKYSLGDQLSIGARVGYLVAPSILFFSTFGYAHSDAGDLTADFGTASTRASLGAFNGYFIGGGIETLIYDKFSIKAEYRYTSMRSEDAVFDDTITETVKPQIQTMRMSLTYRFGDGKKVAVDTSIPPITSNWTGPYLGVGGGYSIAKNQTTFSGLLGPAVDRSDNGNQGGFIAFSAGYDLQVNPKVVIGTFGDADLSNLHYSEGVRLSAAGATAGETIRSDYKDILMAGARIGYLTTPDTLLFVTGGYANAGLGDTTLNCDCVGLGGPPSAALRLFSAKRFSGAFIGAGAETKIWKSLSIKAEYRYVDLSSEDMTLLPDGGAGINQFIKTKIDPDIQMGRVSVNWRFNGGALPPD